MIIPRSKWAYPRWVGLALLGALLLGTSAAKPARAPRRPGPVVPVAPPIPPLPVAPDPPNVPLPPDEAPAPTRSIASNPRMAPAPVAPIPPDVKVVSESPDKSIRVQRRQLNPDAVGTPTEMVEVVSARTGNVLVTWETHRRTLAVLWSPKLSMAAINDFADGSGDALYVVGFTKTGVTRLLRGPHEAHLREVLGKYRKRFGILQTITFAADSWVDENTLKVRIFGRSDIGTFDENATLIFAPDGTFKMSLK